MNLSTKGNIGTRILFVKRFETLQEHKIRVVEIVKT